MSNCYTKDDMATQVTFLLPDYWHYVLD